MKVVRWGLLSTANINRRLIPAIRSSKRGDLVAVASRNRDTAEEYAREWHIPLSFGSYQAMLDTDQIDAVYIGLPNHLHAEWTIKALESGKHVLCEKPFALSLNEVDQMIAASQKNQRYLAEAFMYRHHPQTKILGEWVQSGRLGEITLVKSTFNFLLSDRNNVRLTPEFGGGCLWDVGIYPVSLVQYIYGSLPRTVYGSQILGTTGVDETFAGLMTYSRNRLALISSSFQSPFFTRAEIMGTKGRIELNRPFNNMEDNSHMVFYAEESLPHVIEVPHVDLYSGEVEDLHRAVLDGTPPLISLHETRNHIETILSLYESASQNQVIQLRGLSDIYA